MPVIRRGEVSGSGVQRPSKNSTYRRPRGQRIGRRASRSGCRGCDGWRPGRLIASVERKSLADLVSSLTGGKLRYAIADLAALPRAAVVVEDRYSALSKLDRVRPAVIADGLAELQIRWPNVPLVFCETRQLAEEWIYRFLGAAPPGHRQNTRPSPESHLTSAPPTSTRHPQRLSRPPPKCAPGPAPATSPSPTAASSDLRSGTPGAPHIDESTICRGRDRKRTTRRNRRNSNFYPRYAVDHRVLRARRRTDAPTRAAHRRRRSGTYLACPQREHQLFRRDRGRRRCRARPARAHWLPSAAYSRHSVLTTSTQGAERIEPANHGPGRPVDRFSSLDSREESQVDGDRGCLRTVGADEHRVRFIEEGRSSTAVDLAGEDPHSAGAAKALPAGVRHVGQRLPHGVEG
ncbi:hypothetical protein NG2371_03506 [Nocardia gamkensis]|nr:hypothetical protein [Nocardia gamkensis]